jgi:alkylhydroperoxidase family enzyme
LYHLSIWRESSLFTPKERAALEWTEAVTKIAGNDVPDELFQRVRKELSEKELADLTFAIGVINFWNRLNVGFKTAPGSADEMLGLTKAGLR